MTIIFLTLQPEICHIFANNLPDHTCFVFSQPENFLSIIRNMKNPPDLLVLDYTLFNHDIFNIYEQMEDECTHIPAIFYNEPCTSKLSRAKFWEYIIKYEDCFNKDLDTSIYVPVFEVIQKIVEDPDLSAYIPLMQKPKPLPQNFLKHNLFSRQEVFNTLEKQLYTLHHTQGMTPSKFYLLQLFYQNLDKYITLEQIQEEYKKDNREISISSLKVQISRLRTIMKNTERNRLIIINNKNGYKMVEFV